MKTFASAVLVLFACSTSLLASDLKTYKATYDKQMEAIVLGHGMKTSQLGQSYTKALGALLTKVKAAGDLDKSTATMDEIKRFSEEQGMPSKASSVLDIQNLQTSYTKQASVSDATKAQKVVFLAAKYDQALEGLQKSLVSSDNFDDAKAVQAERKRVKESKTYADARKHITAHATTIVPAKTTPQPKSKTETHQVTVSAMNNDKKPFRTEIVLKKGDRITITPNEGDKWGGGGSKTGILCTYRGYGKSKDQWMAMQYEIASTRDYVKARKMITVTADGELTFFCNDGNTTGNVGKIRVKVVVMRK